MDHQTLAMSDLGKNDLLCFESFGVPSAKEEKFTWNLDVLGMEAGMVGMPRTTACNQSYAKIQGRFTKLLTSFPPLGFPLSSDSTSERGRWLRPAMLPRDMRIVGNQHRFEDGGRGSLEEEIPNYPNPWWTTSWMNIKLYSLQQNHHDYGVNSILEPWKDGTQTIKPFECWDIPDGSYIRTVYLYILSI